MNQLRIYIGGVGGVGKTTIARKLANKYHMTYLTGSLIMMTLCGVHSREELSALPKDRVAFVRKMKYPSFVSQNKRVIVDGHCELFPEEAECFNLFIFLVAPARIIQKRRGQRKDNRRDTSLRTILAEQKIYRQKMKAIEKECKIKFMVVSNAGSVTRTCELIEDNLRRKGIYQH